MRKSVRISVVAMVMGALLTACSGKAENVDVTKLGEDLLGQIEYQDELMSIDPSIASMFLNLSDVNIVNASVYEGSGATAEEIVVFECASEQDAAKAAQVLEERVEQQKESFEDYVPEELEKLNKSVIKSSGKYAVLSVSNDPDKAAEIIKEHF